MLSTASPHSESSVAAFVALDKEAARRALYERIWIRLAQLAAVAVLLVVWEWLSISVIDPFWIGRPTEIGARLYEWFRTGYIFPHIGATALVMLSGIACGTVAGVTLGFVIGTNRTAAQIFDPLITAVYSVPKVALAPLFVLWFGIGLAPKITLTAATVFFIMFRHTIAGINAVDPDLVDVVRVLGANNRQMRRLVIWPSATSWIFSGLRLSVPYALIAAVVAEFVVSSQGLGYLIRFAGASFDTASVFGALVVLGVSGFLVNELVRYSESKASPWRRDAGLREIN